MRIHVLHSIMLPFDEETQIHGELCFAKHVERLVAHPRHRKEPDQARVEAVAKKFGWKFSWIDEAHSPN